MDLSQDELNKMLPLFYIKFCVDYYFIFKWYFACFNFKFVSLFWKTNIEQKAILVWVLWLHYSLLRNHYGLMAVEFADKDTKEPFPNSWQVGEAVTKVAYDLGLIVYPKKSLNGIAGDHILVTPPLIITFEESDKLLNLLTQTFESYNKIIKSR